MYDETVLMLQLCMYDETVQMFVCLFGDFLYQCINCTDILLCTELLL